MNAIQMSRNSSIKLNSFSLQDKRCAHFTLTNTRMSKIALVVKYSDFLVSQAMLDVWRQDFVQKKFFTSRPQVWRPPRGGGCSVGDATARRLPPSHGSSREACWCLWRGCCSCSSGSRSCATTTSSPPSKPSQVRGGNKRRRRARGVGFRGAVEENTP